MAFAQRYHAQWDDLYGVHRGVEIYEKDYGGSSEPIEVYGTSPGRKRMRGIRGDEDKLINGTEFEFTFVTNNSDKSDFDHLFESNYKDHYLVFYKNYEQSNQQIKFRGWLKPENMKRVFIDAVYHITVSATDALADLKDIDFLQSDGSFYEGELSALEAIKEALDKINTDSDSPFALDFRIVSNIHETSLMNTDTSGNPTDNALRVTNIDTRRFLKDDGGRVKAASCNEVIERVLFDFNCKIKQKDDQYWIVDNDESAYAGDNEITHYVHEIAWNDLTTSTRSEITNYKNITDDVQFQRGGDFSKLKPLKGLDVIFKNRYQGSDFDDDAGSGDPLLGDWNDWTVTGAVSSNVNTEGTLEVECDNNDYSCIITSPEFDITEETDWEYIKLIFSKIATEVGGISHFFVEVKKPWVSDWFSMEEVVYFNGEWEEFVSPNSDVFRVANTEATPTDTYQLRIRISGNVGTGPAVTLKLKSPTVRKIVPTGAVSGDSDDVFSFVTRDVSYIGQQAGGLGIPETDTWFGDSENQYDIGRLSISGTLTELWNRFNRSDASPIIDLKIQSRLNNRKKYASIVKFTYVDTEDVIDIEKVLKIGSNSFGAEEGWYEVIGLDKEYFKGVTKITARQLFIQDVTLSFTSSQLRSADGTSTTSPYNETGGGSGGSGSGAGGDNPVFWTNEIFHNNDYNFNTVNDQTFNFNSINQDRNLFNFYENDFGGTENFLGGINYDYSSDSLLLNQIDLNLDNNNITNISEIDGGGVPIIADDGFDFGGLGDLTDIRNLDLGGQEVSEILTTMPGTPTDDQLLTAPGIKDYVDANAGSQTLAEVLTQGNTANMDIVMAGNGIGGITTLRGNDTGNDRIQFNSGDVSLRVDDGSGSLLLALTARDTTGQVDIHTALSLPSGTSVNEIVTAISSPTDNELATASAIQDEINAIVGAWSLEDARGVDNTMLGDVELDGGLFIQAVGGALNFNTDNSDRALVQVFEDSLGGTDNLLGRMQWDYSGDRFRFTKGIDIDSGSLQLASGPAVDDIVTNLGPAGNISDSHLATSKAINDLVNNISIDLEDARSEGNSFAGDVTFSSGSFSLASGTSVNEISTDLTGSNNNNQLATASAINSLVAVEKRFQLVGSGSSNRNLSNGYYEIVESGATLTLESSQTKGREAVIKGGSGGGSVNPGGTGGNIDGSSSWSLAQFEFIKVVKGNGNDWHIVAINQN